MSRTNRNFVIAYALLVVLPVFGLAGILKQGRKLSAPVSVDGTWKLQPAKNASCGLSSEESFLSISQSGKNFSVALTAPKLAGDGVVEGNSLRAAIPNTDPECGTINLSADIQGQGDSKSLVGTLSVERCPSCALDFRAVRQAPPKMGAR